MQQTPITTPNVWDGTGPAPTTVVARDDRFRLDKIGHEDTPGSCYLLVDERSGGFCTPRNASTAVHYWYQLTGWYLDPLYLADTHRPAGFAGAAAVAGEAADDARAVLAALAVTTPGLASAADLAEAIAENEREIADALADARRVAGVTR